MKCGNTLFIFWVLLLSACTKYQVIKADRSTAAKAPEEIPTNQLLDIGISVFDAGIPEDEATINEKNIFPDVRRAEAHYIPYELKKTIEQTGQWGSIRIIPTNSIGLDVIVSGQIIASDGEFLVLRIAAKDSVGNVWLQREYSQRASKYAYVDHHFADRDPFQAIYNRISNDLFAVKKHLDDKRLENIRTVAELRFAQAFLPDVFGDHLVKDKQGKFVVDRLPARDDPMLERIRLIKRSDHMFLDLFDQHHNKFSGGMSVPYRKWRKSSYDEVLAMQKSEQHASEHGVLLGGMAVVGGLAAAALSGGASINAMGSLISELESSNGIFDDDQAEIHVEALRELSASFNEDVSNQVIDIEGKTLTLEGSSQRQYNTWRQMLREFYASQTGFTLGQNKP